MFDSPRRLATLFLVLVLVAAVFVVVARYTPRPPVEGLEVVGEAWDFILSDYVDQDEIDAGTLSEGAIRGMIESLEDPWSSYITAEQYEMVHENLQGKFGGIGAVVSTDGGEIVISEPIEGGPAEKAGIVAGDRILGVDGESTAGMTVDQAVSRIRGEEGTDVSLLVLHPDADEPVEIVITREIIELDTVELEMPKEDIAVVDIAQFSASTTSEFESALKDALSSGASAIILDLRGNPGGLLSVAVDVASQFLDDGIVLYSMDAEDNRKNYEVNGEALVPDVPVVVLVNDHSASASEIVAGALQDRDRAILVGTQTVGKGSVNLDFRLSDGSAVRLTTQRWYTPSGHQIEGNGLTPDIQVQMTPEDMQAGRDPQLQEAFDYLESVL